MNLRISGETRSLVKKALEEDLGSGDITTRTLIPRDQRGTAVITTKESGVFCGGPVAREVFLLRNRSVRVKLYVKEGSRVKKGGRVISIRGRTKSILEAERVALNFLGRLSGIATLTRSYVDKIQGTRAKIFDTRKTTPLWRELEKYAVRSGGGENHRFGLFDEVLVKDNHWRALMSSPIHSAVILRPRSGRRISRSSRLCRTRRRVASLRMTFGQIASSAFGGLAMTARRLKIPVEVEVRNLKELAHLLEGTFVPDRVLLDNFSVRELRRAVLFVHGLDYVLRKRYGIHRKTVGARRAVPLLEASGGITLANVRAVAQTGVDRISVGRLTHSAPSLDFSLVLTLAQ